MKSPDIPIFSARAELATRFVSVMQASVAIRSEVALTVCESSESRLLSEQLRMDSREATRQSAAQRQGRRARAAQKHRWISDAIVQALSQRGYSAFLAAPPQDTASIQ